MIRFGPAGIALSCKGRTLKDGIEDVHNLGLTALEVQMVRANILERPPEEEEVGCCLCDLEEGLVIEILRDDGEDMVPMCDPRMEIEEDDVLITMAYSITNNYAELVNIGKMARQLDVSLSLHTPYYMDLGANNELTVRCMDNIRHAGLLTHALQGDIVVTHMGLYNGQNPQVTAENITNNIEAIMGWWQDAGLTPRLGLEVSGRQEVFGSLDEILEICDMVEGVVPVLNFPHYHARENGALMDSQDFIELFEKVSSYTKGPLHAHFAGVEYDDGNERRLTPIKKGDLRFEHLAEALVEERPEMTIISSSPLLEHDAMYMKVIHERVLTKKVAKALRLRRKEEDEAVKVNDEWDDDE
ncbi:MAG: TIM barrel protein [Candidatus Methanomethylophilaceae archaeon]|nr:TIM barrel protein [Candidatus Methanomethylophilaceae archaeon]